MRLLEVPIERRWNYKNLLLLADPEEQAVQKYLFEGDMYVLQVDGQDVCEAVICRTAPSECELMNLATREDMQGRGYASTLAHLLMKQYSETCSIMRVGTSEDGRAFYRRLGFQDELIRKNFFLDNYEHPIFENGRQCTDMYCLKVDISNG